MYVLVLYYLSWNLGVKQSCFCFKISLYHKETTLCFRSPNYKKYMCACWVAQPSKCTNKNVSNEWQYIFIFYLIFFKNIFFSIHGLECVQPNIYIINPPILLGWYINYKMSNRSHNIFFYMRECLDQLSRILIKLTKQPSDPMTLNSR